MIKICWTCKESKDTSEYHSNGYHPAGGKKYKPSCKACTYKNVYQRLIDAKEQHGGSCKVCGFNASLKALEFHHLDPFTKDFNISAAKSYGIEKFNKELEKCILVCANCHRQIHEGSVVL
jgi:hypothetical protein